jgi:uncharacterized membrane-anchored protein YitT (DUF2179 family)
MSEKIKRRITPYAVIFMGCALMTFGMNMFLIPFKLAPGGVSGLATVLHYVSGGLVPVGVLMLAMNIPLFLLGWKSKGRGFMLRSLFGTVVLSLQIDLTAPLANRLLEDWFVSLDVTMATPDLLLNALAGGLIMGVGLAFVLREDATTGGTDMAASILRRFIPHLSIGTFLMGLDAMVVLFAAFAFHSIKLGLYASVSLYVASKTIDAFLEGINFAKTLMIISDHSEQIANRLMHEIGRGVTGLSGIGMYSGSRKTVLLCVVKRGEIPQVKQVVRECDPLAFVLLSDTREVLGEGFVPFDPHP